MRFVEIIPGQPYKQETKVIKGTEFGEVKFIVPYSTGAQMLANLWAMGFKADPPRS